MHGVTRLDVCEDVALISFHKIPLSLPVMADIFNRFSQDGIIIDMISQTSPVGDKVNISFTCLDSDIVKVLALIKELNKNYPELRPMVSSGNSKVQLYGEEMRAQSGVFAKALDCLSSIGVELQQITTSEVDISLLVTAPHRESAVKALTEAFSL